MKLRLSSLLTYLVVFLAGSAVTAVVFNRVRPATTIVYQSVPGPSVAVVTPQPAPASVPEPAAESGRSSPLEALTEGKPAQAPVPSEVVPVAAAPEALPAVEPPYNKVYVLAVGISRYPSGWIPLKYAANDAREIGALMSNRFGFVVTVLLDEEATKARFESELTRIRQVIQPTDDFILFFSGHGVTFKGQEVSAAGDQEKRSGFLATFAPNSSPTAAVVSSYGVDMRSFAQALLEWPARHRLVVLDACFSGYAMEGGSMVTIPEDTLRLLQNGPTLQIMTAGKAQETAHELDRLQHGAFSYAIMEILREKRSHSAISLFVQARERTIQESAIALQGRSGTPQYRTFIPTSKGDFVFIPDDLQARWLQTEGIAPPIKGREALSRGISDEEYKVVIQQANLGQVQVDKEKMNYYEDRASMGDTRAMAVLTEVYGTSKNPEEQKKAAAWAREGYDTADTFGVLALSRIFEKGYGVEKNLALVQLLRKDKNLGALAEVFPEVVLSGEFRKPTTVAEAVALARDNPGAFAQIGKGLNAGKKFVVGLFGRDPVNAFKDDLKKISGSVEKRDWPRVREQVVSLDGKLGMNDRDNPEMKDIKELLRKEIAPMNSDVAAQRVEPLEKRLADMTKYLEAVQAHR